MDIKRKVGLVLDQNKARNDVDPKIIENKPLGLNLGKIEIC